MNPADESLPCGRRHPAPDVFQTPDGPTILFATICTLGRRRFPSLADTAATLSWLWQYEARAWITGRHGLGPWSDPAVRRVP